MAGGLGADTSEFKYSAEHFERVSDEVIGPEFRRKGLHWPRPAEEP